MSTLPTRLFLTGATGFLGHYVLATFLRRGNVRCTAMVRPPLEANARRLARLLAELDVSAGEAIRQGRLKLVEGNLPDDPPADVLRNTDVVVHAAGSTRFDADASGEPARTNVAGTSALLDACRHGGVRRFVLVSTIYVCGTRTGDIPEAPLREPPAFHNDYERSKWTAEQLVRGWASEGGTATIVRPAILIGDRTRGRSTRFNGIYVIARAAEILRRAADGDPRTDRHRIPLRLPGRGEATCQMVPVDWAAERLAEIATNPKARGLVHHLTNPDPPTHADVKAWLESYFDIGGGRFVEGSWPLKDPNPFEEAFYSLGQVVRDYFRSGLTFADRFHESGPRRGLVDRASFFRCLHYAQAHNWGRSPVEQPVPSSHRWVDPEWYFEDFLPRTIPTSSVARTHGLTTTVRFHIRPPDHVWVCRFRAGKLLSVHPANGEGESEFGYRVTGDAFSRIVTGQEPVQAAFFRGEAQIDGNVERALQMVPIMTQFLHEHPVRHAPTA